MSTLPILNFAKVEAKMMTPGLPQGTPLENTKSSLRVIFWPHGKIFLNQNLIKKCLWYDYPIHVEKCKCAKLRLRWPWGRGQGHKGQKNFFSPNDRKLSETCAELKIFGKKIFDQNSIQNRSGLSTTRLVHHHAYGAAGWMENMGA